MRRAVRAGPDGTGRGGRGDKSRCGLGLPLSRAGRPRSGPCWGGGGCGTAVALRLRNSPRHRAAALPFLSGPGAAMGSRASTLLRDEEIEEIKKETGCECGSVRRGGPGSAGGWGGRLGARSGAAPRPSSRGGGASAGRAAVCLLTAARRAVPGAAGPGRWGQATATAVFPAGQCLAPGRDPAVPGEPGRTCLVGLRKPGKGLSVRLPAAAAGRRAGAALGGRRPRPGAGRNPRATRLLRESAGLPPRSLGAGSSRRL